MRPIRFPGGGGTVAFGVVFLVLLIVVVALIGACGGSSNSPSPVPSPGGRGATVTITSAGVNPSHVDIPVGQTVTFVNTDTGPHEIASDPHPAHTDCPAINQVGRVQPGQARQTGSLTSAGTCAFHDHLDPNNAALKGSITIR